MRNFREMFEKGRGHATLYFLLPAFNYRKEVAGVIAAILEYEEA